MKTNAIPALTLTNTEHNVLMVALDHMYEHLNNLVDDRETFEEENTNLKRIDAVKSLKEMFNL
jgi:DhnA family fructose-bisphosphate aldolase class Ia